MSIDINGANARMSVAVGEVNYANGSQNIQARGGRQGEIMVSELHGKYTSQVLAGNVFSCSNQAKVAATAGLATTWTGLGVSNPTGSGYNLALLEFGFGTEIAADAAGAVGLMWTTNSGFASGSITCYNRLIGGRGSVALADNGATIATPILIGTYFTMGTLAVTGIHAVGPFTVNLDGSIVIPPGYAVCSYVFAATTATHQFHFMWEEIPV